MSPDAQGGNDFCNACPADRGGGTPQAAASGTSEVPGNDFMISLGDRFFNLGRPASVIATEEGGTILHELGHNLGLSHGVAIVGGMRVPALAPEYNPIYFSVMNYDYQFGLLFAAAPGSAIPTSVRLDFADDTQCADLVESALVEADGARCGATSTRVIRYIPNTGTPRFASATTGTAIDWDGANGIGATAAPVDLNGQNGTTETFYSLDEWRYANGKFTTLKLDSACTMYAAD